MAASRDSHQGISTAKTPKLYTGLGLGDVILGRALNKT